MVMTSLLLVLLIALSFDRFLFSHVFQFLFHLFKSIKDILDSFYSLSLVVHLCKEVSEKLGQKDRVIYKHK